jgi:hypothetical protein
MNEESWYADALKVPDEEPFCRPIEPSPNLPYSDDDYRPDAKTKSLSFNVTIRWNDPGLYSTIMEGKRDWIGDYGCVIIVMAIVLIFVIIAIVDLARF